MPDFIDPIFNEDEDIGMAGDLDETDDDMTMGDLGDNDSEVEEE